MTIGEVIAFYDDEGNKVEPYSDDATAVDVRYGHGIERIGWVDRRPGWTRRQRQRATESDTETGGSLCSDSRGQP